MSNFKLKKDFRILWETTTKNRIEDIDYAGDKSVTECWRDDIEAFETDDKKEKDDKIETEKIKDKDIPE